MVWEKSSHESILSLRFVIFLIRFANVSPYTYRKLAPIRHVLYDTNNKTKVICSDRSYKFRVLGWYLGSYRALSQ